MPREAKFSPVFHEVSPATVPPHSFCQIFLPMPIDSAAERLIPSALAVVKRAAMANRTAARGRKISHLDARPFPPSVLTSATPPCRSGAAFLGLLLMKSSVIFIAALSVTSTLLAQDKAQLK